MTARSKAVRTVLYGFAFAFVLYMAWPLLTGQGWSRRRVYVPSTKIVWPVVTRSTAPSQLIATQGETTTPDDNDIPPLDGPVDDIYVMAGWKLTNCGNESDPLRFRIYEVVLDKEYFGISFELETDVALFWPLQLNMSQWSMVEEDEWVPVPCYDVGGTCYFEDLCKSLGKSKCPSFQGEVTPSLQCPVEPGSYSIPIHYYPVEPESWLKPLATRYHFKHKGMHLACYDMVVIAEKI